MRKQEESKRLMDATHPFWTIQY